MKTVTQKDLQNLYHSPDYDRTEEMRRTLAKLPDRKTPETRPVVLKRRVTFILAAALILMGIAAAAVGLYTGTLVSWGAKQSETEVPAIGMTGEQIAPLKEVLDSYPDESFVVMIPKEGTDSYYKGITRDVSSPEELYRILDEAGYRHPGQLIPAGWTFSSAVLSYGCVPDGKYEQVSETETADGRFTVREYKLDEQYRIPDSYALYLKNGSKEGVISSVREAKEYITVFSVAYPADGKVQSKAISVPGMEDALFTEYDGSTELMMYRPLETPVYVNQDWSGTVTDGSDIEKADYEMIHCSNLEPEEVIPIFTEVR